MRIDIHAITKLPLELVLVLVLAASQQATPPRRSQEPSIFRATLDQVRVDVIVTDGEGRFVDDLGAGAFVIYEDGEPQEVQSLQLVDLAEGRIVEQAAAGPGSEGASTPRVALQEIRADTFGAIVYLVDFPSLDQRIKQRFVETWAGLLERTDSITLPHAVYLVDNVGRLREVAALTTDVDVLRDAVEEVGETANTNLPPAPGIAQVGPWPETEMEKLARTTFTFELLSQFSQALAARPGRTALVWVSMGVTLTPIRAGGTRPRPGYNPNLGVLNLQRDMHRAANSSNVSIYGVDPSRWADTLAYVESEPGGAGFDAAGNPRASSFHDELGNSLRAAADETGGRAFVVQAELENVLETIVEESSRYYLLTYTPPPPSGDGEYHEIRVEVSRPGVEVRGRQGYVDYSPEERWSRFVSAALSQPGMVADLPIRVDSEIVEWDGDRAVVETTVRVETQELVAATGPDGAERMVLEVHAALLDDDLDLVDELHRAVEVPIIDDLPEVDDAPPEAGSARDFVYRHRWQVRPGEYDLRVMVQDTFTGRVGALGVPFEVERVPFVERSTGNVAAMVLRKRQKPGFATRPWRH